MRMIKVTMVEWWFKLDGGSLEPVGQQPQEIWISIDKIVSIRKSEMMGNSTIIFSHSITAGPDVKMIGVMEHPDFLTAMINDAQETNRDR